MNYQDLILDDIQLITGIKELSKQGLYAVICSLIKSGRLNTVKPLKYISKRIYESLRRFLLNGDNFVSGISIFKDYYNRWKEYMFKLSDEYKYQLQLDYNKILDLINKEEYDSSETNMDFVADLLLKNDDVYFEKLNYNKMRKNSKRALYESIMRNVAKQVKKSLNESYETSDEIPCSIVVNTDTIVIGDPCYVLPDEIYDEVWGAKDFKDGVIREDVGIVCGTYSGDGSYYASSGKEYGVDSGTLGIFNGNVCIDDLDTDFVRIINVKPGEHRIGLDYDEGTFFLSIDYKDAETIYTGPEEDDEDDEWEDDDEDFYDNEDEDEDDEY